MMQWRRAIPARARLIARDRLYERRARADPSRIGLDVLAGHLPDAPTVIEAGAHVGGDTRAIARRWRSGMVHAFEPVPELYAALTRSVSNLDNVRCHPVALGAASGNAEMWVSSGSSDGSSSLRRPKTHLTSHPDVTFETRAAVVTVTLDEFCATHDVQPDLLWLDLQGAELDALRAGETVLPQVRLVHTEVSVREEYEGCALYDEVREWLAARGFTVLVEALPQGDPQGNVLFGRVG